MDFPILDLLDPEASEAWLEKHFHPEGLKCPHCQAEREAGRFFRVNRGSGLPVYRCRRCQGVYHLYSGTVLDGSQLPPEQVVLLLRGVLQGQSSHQLARDLGLTAKPVLKWRHRLQAQAEQLQPTSALPDVVVEADELFQNAGEKGGEHFAKLDRLGNVATSAAGVGRGPMTVPLYWRCWGARANKFACGSDGM